jgi:hypothetical protein
MGEIHFDGPQPPPPPQAAERHATLGELLIAVREAKARAPTLDEIVAALAEARARAAAAYEQSARAAGEEHSRKIRRLEDTMRSQVDQANADAEAELKAARREIEERRRAKVDLLSSDLSWDRRVAAGVRDAAIAEAARIRDDLLGQAGASWEEVTAAFTRMCSYSAAAADVSFRALSDLRDLGVREDLE